MAAICTLGIPQFMKSSGDWTQTMCKTLPVFHAFTGCDAASAFGGRGKKTAWNVWKVLPDVTKAFEEDLMLMEDSIND